VKCPYCKKDIYGMTGLQELHKFEKHLRRCRKNPANKVLKVGGEVRGGKTIVISGNQTFADALRIRADSGQ
jgi:hypothetical protein